VPVKGGASNDRVPVRGNDAPEKGGDAPDKLVVKVLPDDFSGK